jgi:hypothetical protein
MTRSAAPQEGVFHPKICVGTAGQNFTAILGSSHLIGPTLTKNVELNVLLTDTLQDAVAGDLNDFFRNL